MRTFSSHVFVNYFLTKKTFTLYIFQESIDDEVIADAILSLDFDKRWHFSDGISLNNGNDFEENDMCNDLAETFCEYNIDD